MSPRIEPWSRADRIGGTMTPHMVKCVLALNRTWDSIRAAKMSGVERLSLITIIRYVEKKTGYRLFRRHNGMGNTTWSPIAAAKPFFEWCKLNPNGGTDFPKEKL